MHIEVILERTEGKILSNYYRHIETLVIKQQSISRQQHKSLSVVYEAKNVLDIDVCSSNAVHVYILIQIHHMHIIKYMHMFLMKWGGGG